MSITRILTRILLDVRTTCITLLILGITTSGCRHLKSKPPTPLPPVPPPAPPVSTLDLPILIKQEALRKTAESQIPPEFHFDGTGDKTFSYKIPPFGPTINHVVHYWWNADLARGNIAMSFDNDHITASTGVSGRAGVRIEIPPTVSHHADIAATVGASTSLSMGTNWNITPHSSPILNITKADASFHINLPSPFPDVDIPITFRDKLTAVANPRIGDLARKLDERISSIDVRSMAAKEWAKLNEPIKLPIQPDTWLRLQPVSARYTGIRNDNSNVLLGVGLDAVAEIHTGKKPNPFPTNSLPPLGAANPGAGFSLHVPVRAAFSDLTAVAKSNLLGSTFLVAGSVKVKLNDIAIHGNGTNLVVMAAIDAKLTNTCLHTKGRVYFTGQPIYDPSSKNLRIANFDYDVNTRNILVTSADWLLHPAFRSAIAEKLRWDVSTQLLKAQQLMNKSIENLKLRDGIFLRGKLNEANAAGIVVLPDALVVLPILRGQATLSVDALNF